MITRFTTSLLAALVLLAVTPDARAVFIYDVARTVGFGTVTGTITTDETMGALDPTVNFTAWSLTLFDGVDSSPLLTEANSSFSFAGSSGFLATLNELLFDFSYPGQTASTVLDYPLVGGQNGNGV